MTSLRHIVEGWGNAPFIRGTGGVVSYREFASKVIESQKQLSQAGIREGDVAMLQSIPSEASIASLVALLDLGAHVFTSNLRWPDAMVAEARDRIGVQYSLRPSDRGEIEILTHRDAAASKLKGHSPSIIIATSGSTGSPKFAVLPIDALLASARGANEVLALHGVDCWQLSLPLFHVGGLGIVFRVMLAGASLAVLEQGELVESEVLKCVTFISLVPTQLYRLLRNPDARGYLQQQRCILIGGAPIGADLCRQALSMNLPIVPSYGLTEMGSIVTANTSFSVVDDDVVSMGRAPPQREITIAPSGEILVRGDCLFEGYLSSEGVVRETDEVGWFGTRDIGSFTNDGSLVVTGRIDSQFISGGENIHPEMIEQALMAIPPVVAACVVPLDDPEFGQRPFALVVSDGGTFDQLEIIAQLKSSIPSFAVPTGILEAPGELVTGSGKIDRRSALRYAQERGLHRAALR